MEHIIKPKPVTVKLVALFWPTVKIKHLQERFERRRLSACLNEISLGSQHGKRGNYRYISARGTGALEF